MGDRIIHQIAPLFGCRDLSEAIETYRNLLGFALRFRRLDDYAIVTRGDVDIHLEKREDGVTPGAACLMVSGLDELYEELLTAGVTLPQVICATPDGVRQFVALDDDGNRLIFVEEA